MAGPAYTFRAVSSVSGAALGELPLLECKWTRLRSSAGAWDAKLKLSQSDALQRMALIDNTANNQIELAIERNGRLVYSGLLIDRDYDSKTEQLTIGGRESWAYLDRRINDADLTYTAIDQGLIVQDILTRVAAAPGGDFRIDLPTTAQLTTGVLRTISYAKLDAKPISELLQDLSQQNNGFEFSLEPYWSAGVLRHQLNFGSPMIGVRGGALVAWDLPGNISSYRWQEQGGAQATEIFGIGDDATGKPKLQRYKILSLTLPLLQLAASFRAIAQPGSLLDWTIRRAQTAVDPQLAAFVTVVGGLRPDIGEFSLGDDVSFQFNDARFRNVSQLFRLAGYTVTCPKAGQHESIELLVDAIPPDVS